MEMVMAMGMGMEMVTALIPQLQVPPHPLPPRTLLRLRPLHRHRLLRLVLTPSGRLVQNPVVMGEPEPEPLIVLLPAKVVKSRIAQLNVNGGTGLPGLATLLVVLVPTSEPEKLKDNPNSMEILVLVLISNMVMVPMVLPFFVPCLHVLLIAHGTNGVHFLLALLLVRMEPNSEAETKIPPNSVGRIALVPILTLPLAVDLFALLIAHGTNGPHFPLALQPVEPPQPEPQPEVPMLLKMVGSLAKVLQRTLNCAPLGLVLSIVNGQSGFQVTVPNPVPMRLDLGE